MIVTSSLPVLLVTEDQSVFSQCSKELGERFNIEVYRISYNDMNQSLVGMKPILIIWDSRLHSNNKRHYISWLRDHFSGRPIIALMEGDQEELREMLHRFGVHILLDVESSSFFQSLQIHVFAILLDREKEKMNDRDSGRSPIPLKMIMEDTGTR